MLHLLSCALWEREPDVHLFDASGTDWQGILDIARRHTVHGLVASRMKAVARELEAEDVVEQCWLTMLEVGRANSQLDSVLADVVKALGVAGERAVLMKGQGVARYYAEPSLRVCGDIDLYTGSHTYEVSQRLTELVEGVAFTDEGNTIKHRSGSLRDVPLELHRLIVTDRGHKSEKLENAWADKELFGPHTRFAQLAGCQVEVPGKLVQSPEESTADACKRLGVTEAELQELWQIARNRGEKTLPSRDWVEHVYRPMKKARKASL